MLSGLPRKVNEGYNATWKHIIENYDTDVYLHAWKDEEWEKLFETIAALSPLNPSYVSVTYGAGGSTRSRTHNLVTRIQQETGLTVVSHLTCICSDNEETGTILQNYRENGINNVLALRGDKPA